MDQEAGAGQEARGAVAGSYLWQCLGQQTGPRLAREVLRGSVAFLLAAELGPEGRCESEKESANFSLNHHLHPHQLRLLLFP